MKMQPEDVVILKAMQKVYFDSLPSENTEAEEAVDRMIRSSMSLLNQRVVPEPVRKTSILK